jgi:pilus assembly protein Flp/PilA
MKVKVVNLIRRMQNLLLREEGQDLIEYALVALMICFAATAGMRTVATNINSAFTRISTTLSSYTG